MCEEVLPAKPVNEAMHMYGIVFIVITSHSTTTPHPFPSSSLVHVPRSSSGSTASTYQRLTSSGL